jgi:hypothetical protein
LTISQSEMRRLISECVGGRRAEKQEATVKEKSRLRQVASRQDLLIAMGIDRLHSQLAARLLRLIGDLAVNDLPLALLDLAQLHRTISNLDAEELAQLRSALPTATLDFTAEEVVPRADARGDECAGSTRSAGDERSDAAPDTVNRLRLFLRSLGDGL